MSTRQRVPSFLKRLISGQTYVDAKALISTIDLCITTIRQVERTTMLADQKISEFEKLQEFIVANTDRLFTKIKPHEVRYYTEVYNHLLQDYTDKTITSRDIIINAIANLWFGPGELRLIASDSESSTLTYVGDRQSGDDGVHESADPEVMSSPVDEEARDEVGELMNSVLATRGSGEDADLIMRRNLGLAQRFAGGRRYRIVTSIPSSPFLDSVFHALSALGNASSDINISDAPQTPIQSDDRSAFISIGPTISENASSVAREEENDRFIHGYRGD